MHVQVPTYSISGLSFPVMLGRTIFNALSRAAMSEKLVNLVACFGVRETFRTGNLKDSAATSVTWQLRIGIASSF